MGLVISVCYLSSYCHRETTYSQNLYTCTVYLFSHLRTIIIRERKQHKPVEAYALTPRRHRDNTKFFRGITKIQSDLLAMPIQLNYKHREKVGAHKDINAKIIKERRTAKRLIRLRLRL